FARPTAPPACPPGGRLPRQPRVRRPMLSGDTDYRHPHPHRADQDRRLTPATPAINTLITRRNPRAGSSPADHSRPHTRSWSGSADRRRVVISNQMEPFTDAVRGLIKDDPV